MKIKKAVIPIAGLGTRLLPYTKAIPKEMLAIIDIPVIHLIIEEVIDVGIESILFVTSKEKISVENYFDENYCLEYLLQKKKEKDKIEQLRRIPKNLRIYSVRQKLQRGLGDAILHAEDFIKDEYFFVLLPDDIIFSKKLVAKQMLEVFQKYKSDIIAVERVPKEKISSYGIIKPKKEEDRIYKILNMIEKPSKKKAFSNLGIVGRYILSDKIFKYIKKTKIGAKNELQITDAIKSMMINENINVYAYEFLGERYDTGNKYGYILTMLKYASFQKEYRERLKKDVKKILDI